MDAEVTVDAPGMCEHMEAALRQKIDDPARCIFNTGMATEYAAKPAFFFMPEFKPGFGAMQKMNADRY